MRKSDVKYMMSLVGQQFGRWTVIGPRTEDDKGTVRWQCECSCGKIVDVCHTHLRGGKSVSCGCLRVEQIVDKFTTHGKSKTNTYSIWVGMLKRTVGKKKVKNYSERGISVCEPWKVFENFYADMGERPSKKHSLERLDGDKDYSPDNCIWATRIVQNNNTRRNHYLTVYGKRQSVSQWVREVGVSKTTIAKRLKCGFPECSVLLPSQHTRKYCGPLCVMPFEDYTHACYRKDVVTNASR